MMAGVEINLSIITGRAAPAERAAPASSAGLADAYDRVVADAYEKLRESLAANDLERAEARRMFLGGAMACWAAAAGEDPAAVHERMARERGALPTPRSGERRFEQGQPVERQTAVSMDPAGERIQSDEFVERPRLADMPEAATGDDPA